MKVVSLAIISLLISGCGAAVHDQSATTQDKPLVAKTDEVKSQLFCENGNPKSCFDKGTALIKADSPDNDYLKVVELFQKACDGGYIPGCTRLGDLYDKGLGVKQDSTLAASLYQKACDGNDATGCASLGNLYLVGQGVEQDLQNALKLLQKACDAGSGSACTNLGGSYLILNLSAAAIRSGNRGIHCPACFIYNNSW